MVQMGCCDADRCCDPTDSCVFVVDLMQATEDIDYLREALLLHMDAEESEETFVKWIYESLHCKYTQLNHAIHTWVHN